MEFEGRRSFLKTSLGALGALAVSKSASAQGKHLPASVRQPASNDSNRVSISLDAEEIYQKALSLENVWWEPGEPGVHLFRGILVENDSPGCGRRDHDAGVFEEVSGNTVLSKELEISGPLPKAAQLVFVGKERQSNDADLEFVVNGHVIVLRPSRLGLPEAKQYEILVGNGNSWSWSWWHYLDIPTGYLRPGKNRILIRSRGGKQGWAIMVADYADFHKGSVGPQIFPRTSAKSSDGGKTWRQDNLGSKGEISGEYVLRVFLDSYRPSGLLLSPVIDAAGEDGVPLKTGRTLREARVRIESQRPSPEDSKHLFVEVRSGRSPVYDATEWSAWSRPGVDGKIANIQGRYLQWRIHFSTSHPEDSPQLKRILLDAEAMPAATHAGKVKIVREHNFELGEGPQGYTYENYQSEYLKKFRETMKLDAVVANAHTEWERQQRLLNWAYLVPLKKERPIFPWDPQNWIQRQPDGSLIMNKDEHHLRADMCLFSDVILVAALQSLGYPARHINLNSVGMSGHEIAEVWSNQFGKWVYLDATRDLFWYDKKTGIPINTLELHNVLVGRFERVETWRRPYLFAQQSQTYLENLPIVPSKHPPYPLEDALFTYTTSAHLRMVPRSDVFSHPSPLPVSQGQEVWCWDGYLNWADAKVPPEEQFSRYTNREKDFNWPLNQVRYIAEETSAPGVMSVRLDHNMPYLAALFAKLDGKEWKKVEDRFQWRLHPGQNTLELQGQNIAGLKGMTSSLVLEYQTDRSIHNLA